MTSRVRFGLWVVVVVGGVAGAMWVATFWEPGSTYKDVEVNIVTAPKTCWVVGDGSRHPDGTLEGMYGCGTGGPGLSDDVTLPPSSAVVQKMTDDDAEIHAEFVVDGEVTETAVLTDRYETVVLSGT